MGESAILSRLREGPATVAYLGTSVTVQRSGYRPRLHAALEAETAHQHRSVLAGVGGADSLGGVFLADLLVLPRRPDVCFIEFATADAFTRTPQAELDQALDSLVYKTIAAGCRPCLVQFPLDPALDPREADAIRRAIDVSNRYGVPLVRLDRHLASLVQAGELEQTDVLRDRLHPGAAGAAAAVAHIIDVLREAGSSYAYDVSNRATSAYDRTTVVPAQESWFADPTAVAVERLNLVQKYLRVRPDNPLQTRLPGDLVGLLMVIGPESGRIRLEHEGGAEERQLWDRDCTYNRLAVVTFRGRPRAGSPVRIELLDRPLLRWDYGVVTEVERAAEPDLRLISALLCDRDVT